MRLLYQYHLDLRAARETRLAQVRDADGAEHSRALATVFGEVSVTRLAYRRRGQPNLYPGDAALNLDLSK